MGGPPTSMPTAENGKSSVSFTAILSDENEEEGLTDATGSEAVRNIAALAISRASSETDVMSCRRPRRVFADPDAPAGVLRNASPERVRSRVRDEDGEEKELSRGGDNDATWLLPASFEKVTLPIYSYAQQELVANISSAASTKGEKRNLERRNAEGHDRIFSRRLRKNAAAVDGGRR